MFTVGINGKSDVVSIERIKSAFYEPHFSLFTAMPDVNNNPAATATAAPGDTPRLVETSQAPTTPPVRVGWYVFHSNFRNSNAQPCRYRAV